MDGPGPLVPFVSTPSARATATATEFARHRLRVYLMVREPSLCAATRDAHVHASAGRVSVLVRKPQSTDHETAYQALAVDLSANGYDRREPRVGLGDSLPDPFERWDWPRSNWESSTHALDE